ncbi:MAG: c-type cytochrome [Anaerolineales bacterium]|nr:c-type cytochrome [Anaerolineales bacterium]
MMSERNIERLALTVLVLILVGIPLAVFGYQYGLRPAWSGIRTIDVIAAAPEAGGFQPASIEVQKGEKVRLRFSVPDVTHGVAVAGLGVDLGQIDPGQVKEVEVVFDEADVVTFYCNTWCSPNHWRMRGTITVIDPADPQAHLQAGSGPDPVIQSLIARQVDIDAPREAPVVPTETPSSAAGQALIEQHRPSLPAQLFESDWLRQHSPAEAYLLLEEHLPQLTGEQRWDIVAYLWTAPLSPEDRAWASQEYAKNCAACHGETGRGDGPAAAAINAQLQASPMVSMTHQVASFAPSPQTMAATMDIYYAKLRRGGMGTSMPSFGPIFNEAETWKLVYYLWELTFTQTESGPTSDHGH